jgi:hypothetical protein
VEDEEALRQVVEDQARARVSGDVAKFASYMTPQALLRLHRQGEPLRGGRGIKNYEILNITMRGEAADTDVRYSGAGSYVLRTRWERREALWKAVMVEMPPGLTRGSWWQRLLRLERNSEPAGSDRRDLR